MMIQKGALISFLNLKNARGYPATGQTTEQEENGMVKVVAWGLIGPGSETFIHDVPITEIEVEVVKLLV